MHDDDDDDDADKDLKSLIFPEARNMLLSNNIIALNINATKKFAEFTVLLFDDRLGHSMK